MPETTEEYENTPLCHYNCEEMEDSSASANTPKRSLFPADSNTADQLPSYNYKIAALLLR